MPSCQETILWNSRDYGIFSDPEASGVAFSVGSWSETTSAGRIPGLMTRYRHFQGVQRGAHEALDSGADCACGNLQLGPRPNANKKCRGRQSYSHVEIRECTKGLLARRRNRKGSHQTATRQAHSAAWDPRTRLR